MSSKESTRALIPRPRWAAWCLVLAAIGGTVWAGGGIAPTCSSDYTDWNPNGGQYAPKSAISQLAVKLVCNARPQANTDCAYCLSYETDVKLMNAVWVPFHGPATATVVVNCGKWDQEIWTTNFVRTIPLGNYRVNAALWIGSCDNPTKTLKEHDYVPFDVTY